jgi:hypothetical protein
LFTFAGALRAQDRPEPLVQQVKASITKGVDYLCRKQRPDGSWPTTKDDPKTDFSGGSTGLAVLALLNCDGIIEDAELEKRRKAAIAAGLKNLRGLEPPSVYARALQTMAFAEAKTDLDRVRANVKWLIDARVFKDGKFMGWNYYSRTGSFAHDASNSQYAMLALWYGRQAGAEVPREVWQSIHDYYRRMQGPEGYWNYSGYYRDPELERPSASMTIAGLCGLLISGAEINGGREQWQKNGTFTNCGKYGDDKALALAFQWITGKREGNNRRGFILELPERTYYHLYGIERAGRLSGLRFFGEHDWYREGCDFLVKRQSPGGAWDQPNAKYDQWAHVNTAFALLFLSKGRTPVLVSKLVHGNWPRREDDTDWNNDRNDLRNLTEYLARDGKLFGKTPLAWQTYDIMRALYARAEKPNKADEDAIVADMRQSPILYITGHGSPNGRIQKTETDLIKRYVENGGFIFAEACCGSPEFDAGFKQWVKDTWDQNLTYIESTDPVWTSHHIIKAGDPFKLMALRVGCRTIMIYSPQDLSCHWESNRYQDGVSQRAFELGANIVAYATGRTPPQPRLTPVEIAADVREPKEPRKRGYFTVGQIRHGPDWQPAPKAMTNLMEHVHKTLGLDVQLRPEQVRLGDEDAVVNTKFLYLHGRNDFKPGGGLDPLRFTLENGGLLFADACCGNEAFDKSFRRFAQELFPKEKLVRVPADDRLFNGKLNLDPITAGNTRCRTKPNGPVEEMAPFLEGIKIDGRWVVLYSKYDIGCALERNTSADCVGYDHASAMRIATAVVRYNTRP